MTIENESKLPSIAALVAKINELNFVIQKELHKKIEPIAIVGMGCRFPGGASNPAKFWEMLIEKTDAIEEIPRERFNVNEYFDTNGEGKMYSRGGGFLKNIQSFDAEFFSISPNEATVMDPQQRLLLEVSWEALENSGIPAPEVFDSKTGVFLGISSSEYLYLPEAKPGFEGSTSLITGNVMSMAAGRLSYYFGFQGPAIALDTSCSSSLVAVHEACTSLRDGSSDMALAAGVNIILSSESYIYIGKRKCFAKDSHCKTFDESADGYVRSEGCGVLVLKRLSDAKADGNPILAIIRGSAINQNGRGSILTAPSGLAQQNVMREALLKAKVEPNQVSYLEAHGTGTALGDQIEVESLAQIYGGKRKVSQPLMIGSVKTNLGHTEAAAGVASIIKTVLSLQNKKIPAHLNVVKINPHLQLEAIPAEIPTESQDWLPLNGRRIAGVSGFGMSGTNAHIIIEEAPEIVPVKNQDSRQGLGRATEMLCLSAKNESALEDLVKLYLEGIFSNSDLELRDICNSAVLNRTHFGSRLAVVGKSKGEMREKLLQWKNSAAIRSASKSNSMQQRKFKLACTFGDLKNLSTGMGIEIYLTEPEFRIAVDRCSEIIDAILPTPILAILWGDNAELLQQEKYHQAGVFLLEYASACLWARFGIVPDHWSGSGVGKWVAACVAGVLSLEDSVRFCLLGPGVAESSEEFEKFVAAFEESSSDLGAMAVAEFLLNSDHWKSFVTTLGSLYVRGFEVNWKAYCETYQGRHVPLPTYPFQRKRYWAVDENAIQKRGMTRGFKLPERLKFLGRTNRSRGSATGANSLAWERAKVSSSTGSSTNKLQSLLQNELLVNPVDKDWLRKMRSVSVEERTVVMTSILLSQVREVLRLEEEFQLDEDMNLIDLGMNSLDVIDLWDRVLSLMGRNLHQSLSPTLWFDYPSVKSVSEYLIHDVLFKQ